MTVEEYAHITRDSQGRPCLPGSGTRVLQIALDHVVHGWTGEEIHFQHPHLPLSHIHSALAYYYDHQEEMDAEIALQSERLDAAEQATAESPLVARLRAAGRMK